MGKTTIYQLVFSPDVWLPSTTWRSIVPTVWGWTKISKAKAGHDDVRCLDRCWKMRRPPPSDGTMDGTMGLFIYSTWVTCPWNVRFLKWLGSTYINKAGVTTTNRRTLKGWSKLWLDESDLDLETDLFDKHLVQWVQQIVPFPTGKGFAHLFFQGRFWSSTIYLQIYVGRIRLAIFMIPLVGELARINSQGRLAPGPQ